MDRVNRKATEPLLYRACGLDDIYLCNGYEIEEIGGEAYTYVDDIEGLHKAIALSLSMNRKTLAPKELRFIRDALDLTQSALGDALGVTSQTVARWEKGQTDISGPADRLLRAWVVMSSLSPDELKGFLESLEEMLNELDESTPAPLKLVRKNKSWDGKQRLAA